MSPTTIFVQTVSTAIALISSGGIVCLSLFDLPILRSQPASRSLPATRWLFSRGSHIFPAASLISTMGFSYLAFISLGPSRSLAQILRALRSSENLKVNGYLAAAVLSFSIGPFTQLVMLPTNFKLIELNEKHGGNRSANSSNSSSALDRGKARERKAIDSVNGEGEGAEFTDLSGPQEETESSTSPEENKRTNELLEKFEVLNAARAVLIGAGGLVGLVTALL